MSNSILFNFEDKKEKIIDIFTTFYGKDYKELIEYKINKVLVINSYNFFSLLNSKDAFKKELLDIEEKMVNYYNKELLSKFPNINPELLFENNCFLDYGLMEYFRDDVSDSSNVDKRIKYFKTIGIDLGDNYQNYLENAEALSKIPSKKVLNDLESVKNKLEKQYISSLNSIASSYHKMVEYFQKENFIIDPNRIRDIVNDTDPSTLVVMQNNKVVPIVFMDTFESEATFGDRGFIHELNHCLSLKVLNIGNKTFNYQMGFISFFGETTKDIYDPQLESELDSSDLFNEIINDLISIDVLNIAKKENFSIISDNYEHSLYETYFPIIKPFYLAFKDAIKRFYITNEFKPFKKEVNKKKLDKLIKVLDKALLYVEKLDDQELIDLNEFEKEANEIVTSMTNKNMKRTI